MTTAWCHLVRGELTDAMRANACGSLLAASAAAAMLVGVWLAVRGAERIGYPSASTCLAVSATFVAGLFGEWLIRLALQEWGGCF
jgi:hypothetical protein